MEFKSFDEFVEKYVKLIERGLSSDDIQFIFTFWYTVLNK